MQSKYASHASGDGYDCQLNGCGERGTQRGPCHHPGASPHAHTSHKSARSARTYGAQYRGTYGCRHESLQFLSGRWCTGRQDVFAGGVRDHDAIFQDGHDASTCEKLTLRADDTPSSTENDMEVATCHVAATATLAWHRPLLGARSARKLRAPAP